MAGKLKKGEHLKTADGTTAVADGGTTPKQRDGWMWDLTVPGNNDHDFYVFPAAPAESQRYAVAQKNSTSILVHNANPGSCDIPTLKSYARQIRTAGGFSAID